jgi:selenocysteine lyase/cysteine desulfurase
LPIVAIAWQCARAAAARGAAAGAAAPSRCKLSKFERGGAARSVKMRVCALSALVLAVLTVAAPPSIDFSAPPPPFGHALRPFFYFAENYTQFNHGAYGGTPRPVIDAQFAAVARMEADIDPFMNGADGYRRCILDARTTFSNMMGTPLNDTVLVDNASEAINAILRNLEPPLSADEYILDLSTAYGPFVGLYEWLGARVGVGLLTVPVSWPVSGPESFTGPVAAFLAANASLYNIRIAVISHISAYPSVLLPVKELVALLHAHNIPVVVDGAHALGNIPFNVVADMGDPEYYFANAHKWYFAPKSSCAMYVRRDRQLPHVPAPAVVDNLETQAFTDRFIWTGTRDRTPYCAIQAATVRSHGPVAQPPPSHLTHTKSHASAYTTAQAFRKWLGGEAAVTAYTTGLARWAVAYLEGLWGVEKMAPIGMHTSMSLVKIPTNNATVCDIVRGGLVAHGFSVSGWAAVGTASNPIPCSFRLSAQVYLESSDFEVLGALTLALIKNATS